MVYAETCYCIYEKEYNKFLNLKTLINTDKYTFFHFQYFKTNGNMHSFKLYLVRSSNLRLCSGLFRVGILARPHVIDPLLFLWAHNFHLKLTITCPLGCACIHNEVKLSYGKLFTMSHFCPPNYQNIGTELHVLN